MKQLTVGSLFSGIGGLDLGLERAGMRVVWQCEIDPYASRVLKKHWPDVPNLGDITQIDFTRVERPDVLCGGFPCQDLSNAGKRVGITGSRSSLWSEYVRAIRDLRPCYVLVENVAALLSGGNGDWFARVLGDLASLGLDAEWDCVPAATVGAPHIRDRLWLVAHPHGRGRGAQRQRRGVAGVAGDRAHDTGPADAQIHAVGTGFRARESRQERGRRPGDGSGAGVFPNPASFRHNDGRGLEREESGERTRLARQWVTEPDVGRVADGVPARVDRLRGLGNAVVPQVAELVGGWIVTHANGVS